MTTLEHPHNLPGWNHLYSGKVRDLYEPADGSQEHLLVVTSNRVSAFDFQLDPPIPGKGALLTALSMWWFQHLPTPNHLATDGPEIPAEVTDRAMLTRRLEMYPIECVVRGALTGSGFAEYEETGSVCGTKLPPGLEDGDMLPEPIYTPAYKAPLGAHDENITFEQSVEIVGLEVATRLRDTSLKIFEIAHTLAASRGILLADTKFEFGSVPGDNSLILADEVLTSDSSRFWDAEVYENATGRERLESFDKQIVRNWLQENWDQTGAPPHLPDEIVTQTHERYRQLFERLTGLPAPA